MESRIPTAGCPAGQEASTRQWRSPDRRTARTARRDDRSRVDCRRRESGRNRAMRIPHPRATVPAAPIRRSGVNRVDLDAGRRRIVILASDQRSFAQVGEHLARKPYRHIEPYQPEVTPDKALLRICDRRAEPVPRVGLEAFVTHSGWRSAAGVLSDHCFFRAVGHPACSSTSWIGSAKISSARSS